VSLPLVQPPSTRVLYVFSVIIVSLFIMAFLWFIMYGPIVAIRTGVVAAMTPYDVENSTYDSFELADTFVTNLWLYFLVIFVIGLAYWVWIYTQRRDVPGAYYT